jgi:sRNA-binding protein
MPNDAQTLLNTVAELYPQCFTAQRHLPHRPLKVGVDKELVAAGIVTPQEAGAMLRFYCSRRLYQAALAAAGPRYGLDGTPQGEVTAEQMEGGRKNLARIDAKQVALAAEQRAAREAKRQQFKQEAKLSRREAQRAKEAVEFINQLKAAKAPKDTEPHKTGDIPAPAPAIRRLGLSDLRAAWQARQAQASHAA